MDHYLYKETLNCMFGLPPKTLARLILTPCLPPFIAIEAKNYNSFQHIQMSISLTKQKNATSSAARFQATFAKRSA